jgi:23S rRNA (cytidine1920-2'-O)/16S rRNA (cytidine1409-2'-O)-methyltransferase
MPPGGFDLIVVDVSFISLTLVLPSLAALAAPSAVLLALVKPQFEVGRAGLDGRGVVRDETLHLGVLETVARCAMRGGWAATRCFDSPIRGTDGNREFFLHARREAPAEAAERTEATR